MVGRSLKVGSAAAVLGLACWFLAGIVPGQDNSSPDALPPVPRGVEVQARGPVHEAFASLAGDPVPTKAIPKAPPKPLEEMPPEEKPEGDVSWINGYWAWDDDRADFLWVSGIWRTAPPGKKWVAGYWGDNSGSSQWVPGFWTVATPQQNVEKPIEQVTYLPAPPAPPQVAPPAPAANPETFFVPGNYVWLDGRYVWRDGYWARAQPGYVWVSAHYRWTPTGFLFIPGYWDLAYSRRGILYAPVIIDPSVVTVGFVYTPAYAVQDTLVIDALFVRPAFCHYYFGDYYGPAYRGYGFESCVVYSRGHYDGLIVYETYSHRSDPAWLSVQITLTNDRFGGRAPLPPRTLVETLRLGGHGLVTPRQLAAARGSRLVTIDMASRQRAREDANLHRDAAMQRHLAEREPPSAHPRVASLHVPESRPAGHVAAPAAVSHPAASAVSHPGTTPPAAGVTHPPGAGAPPPASHPPGAPPGAKPPPPGTKPPPPKVQPGHAPPPEKDK